MILDELRNAHILSDEKLHTAIRPPYELFEEIEDQLVEAINAAVLESLEFWWGEITASKIDSCPQSIKWRHDVDNLWWVGEIRQRFVLIE